MAKRAISHSRRRRRRARWLVGAALTVTALTTTGVVWALLWARSLDLPLAALAPTRIASQRLSDRHGVLLREVLSRPDGRAHWVPLSRISSHIIAATLAGEDQRFFQHRGIDYLAMLRALLLNVARDRIVSGASTLTMQLINLLDAQGRYESTQRRRGSLSAKARQAVLARELELLLDKPAILYQYLNRAPYGAGTFGVEAAAQRYFGKSAAEVSVAEAALLAALPKSPSRYSPLHPASRRRLLARQRYLLQAMFGQGRIDAETLRIARGEPLALEHARRPFHAPHFVQRVLEQPTAAGTSELRTTLDLRLQERVRRIVARTIPALREQGVTNAAVLVVQNATGDVLAHVGSASFGDARHAGQVDGASALRQPGSAIKPFVYALALESGLTPATRLSDLPAHFSTEHGDYAPHNYDGRFHGPVRLRAALANSYNVATVRLTARIGVPRLLDRLRKLGFAALSGEAVHYGLGLSLGNGEVTLHQLVAAYAALANGGLYRPLRVLSATRAPGERRWREHPPATAKRVFSRRASYLVTDILADPLARIPAFGRHGPLEQPFFAAAKTGTSKDFRDNWTLGFTRDLTVGVWVGNFDGSAMHNVSGITGAAPLWAEVLQSARRLLKHEDRRPKRPAGLVLARICPLSGALVGPHCPGSEQEYFFAGQAPRNRCDFHRELRIDKRSGLLAGTKCAEREVEHRQFVVYPPEYRRWAARRGVEIPPRRGSPRCPGAPTTGVIRIRFPAHGDVYYVDPDLRRDYQSVPLEASVEGRVGEVRWLIDGKLFARARYPYDARWPIRPGRHRVVAQLPNGRRSPAVTITVR